MPDLAVVVPIKALDQAKQRLGPFLTPVERAELMQVMARDVLAAVSTAVPLRELWVCCGDQAGAELARQFGAQVVLDERPEAGLNAIIARMAQRLAQAGWERILVVHADLPGLTAEDVAMAGHFDHNELLLVADHAGTGSNLLGWGLHTGFVAHYGEGSHQRHYAQAVRLGLAVRSPQLPWATLDVDRPEDVTRLLACTSADRAQATRMWLARSPLRERLQNVAGPELR